MTKSRALRDLFFALLLLFLVINACPSNAQNLWSGTWETHWATGSARMILSQDGARVTGSYPLLSGQIEAAAEGKLLRGRWSEDKREGSFEFILAEDGQSFIGRRDGVEWWTGAHSQRPQAQMQGSADTPRSTLRSFLNAGNLGRDSDKDQWALAASLLVTDANDPVTSPEDKLARTIEYFRLLDLLTIRFPDLDLFAQTDAREVVVPLPMLTVLKAFPWFSSERFLVVGASSCLPGKPLRVIGKPFWHHLGKKPLLNANPLRLWAHRGTRSEVS